MRKIPIITIQPTTTAAQSFRPRMARMVAGSQAMTAISVLLSVRSCAERPTGPVGAEGELLHHRSEEETAEHEQAHGHKHRTPGIRRRGPQDLEQGAGRHQHAAEHGQDVGNQHPGRDTRRGNAPPPARPKGSRSSAIGRVAGPAGTRPSRRAVGAASVAANAPFGCPAHGHRRPWFASRIPPPLEDAVVRCLRAARW